MITSRGPTAWSIAIAAILALAVAGAAALAALAGSAQARPPADTLDHLARWIAISPERSGETAIAGVVSEVGHWTFVNRAGDRLTAAGPVEVDRVLRLLTGATAPGAPTVPITLLTTAPMLIRARAAFADLPRDAAWRVLVEDRHLAVRKGPDVRDPAAGARIEVRPGVMVGARDEASLQEVFWQVLRPIRRGELRLVALEPSGAKAFRTRAAVDGVSGRPEPDLIDPAGLVGALAGARGQTVVVSGRIDGDRLIAASSLALGSDSIVDLVAVRAAAAAADVNLIVLKTANARQPGSRNWLWLKVGVPGLETALERPTLSDVLSALGAAAEFRIGAQRLEGHRTRLEATLHPTSRIRRSVEDVLAPALTELTGDLTLVGLEGQMRSADRQRELDWRVVPWISAIVQATYLGLLVAGLMGLPIAYRWFGRIWPAESRSEYAGAVGFAAAMLVRGLVFVLLALPILAVPAAVMGAARLAVGSVRAGLIGRARAGIGR